MTSNDSVNTPASLGKSLYSLFSRNDGKFHHSYHDFNDSAFLFELFNLLICERLKTADYCLLDVLQCLFYRLTLRVSLNLLELPPRRND